MKRTGGAKRMEKNDSNVDQPKKGLQLQTLIQEKKALLLGIVAVVAVLGIAAFLMLGGKGQEPADGPGTAGDPTPPASSQADGPPVDPTGSPDQQIPDGQVPSGTDDGSLDVGTGDSTGMVDPSLVQVNTRNWSQYASRYSYTQMTGDEQALYDSIYSMAQSYMNSADLDAALFESYGLHTMNGIDFPEALGRDRAVDVSQWFLHCNPQFWFLKPSVLSTDTTVYMGMLDEAAEGIDRAERTNAIIAKADEWLAEIPDGATPYEIVRAMHDKLCQSVTYVEGDEDQSVYSVFIQGETVCTGYSNAMTMLLNYKGVETVGVASEGHAWNLVKMGDGNWYGLDACWDDELSADTFFLVSESQLKSLDTEDETHIPMDYLTANQWLPPVSDRGYTQSPSDAGSETMEPGDPSNPGGGTSSVVISPPSDLKVSSGEQGSVKVTWTAGAGAQEYEVSVLQGDAILGTMIASHSPATISGAIPTGDFTVRVRSKATFNGVEQFSSPVSVNYMVPDDFDPTTSTSQLDTESDASVPVPNGLNVIETGTDYVRVGWNAADGISKYEVAVFWDANQVNKALQSEVEATSANVSQMSPGQTVWIYVRSISPDGKKSVWAHIQATAGGTPTDGTGVTVAIPENTSFAVVSASTVRLSWNSVTNASSYDVQVFEDAGYSSMKTSGRTANTALRLNGMSLDRTYYVQVRAVSNVNGQEYFSEWARFQVSVAGGESVSGDIGTPSNIQAGMVSATRRLISWTAVEGASGYDVQIGKDQSFSQVLTAGRAKGCTLQVDGASTSRNYWVRVRAVGVVNGQTVTGEWAVVMI